MPHNWHLQNYKKLLKHGNFFTSHQARGPDSQIDKLKMQGRPLKKLIKKMLWWKQRLLSDLARLANHDYARSVSHLHNSSSQQLKSTLLTQVLHLHAERHSKWKHKMSGYTKILWSTCKKSTQVIITWWPCVNTGRW